MVGSFVSLSIQFSFNQYVGLLRFWNAIVCAMRLLMNNDAARRVDSTVVVQALGDLVRISWRAKRCTRIHSRRAELLFYSQQLPTTTSAVMSTRTHAHARS